MARDLLWLERLIENERGQDERFGERVIALDISGGISLGVALRLGLGQHLVVRASTGHSGQDVVSSAVEDAAHALDAGPGHTLADRAEHRRTSHNGGFHAQLYTLLTSQREQIASGQRARPLVGGDYVHTHMQGCGDMAQAWLGVAQVSGRGLDQDIRASLLDPFQDGAPVVVRARIVDQWPPWLRAKVQQGGQVQPFLVINKAMVPIANAYEAYI